MEKKISVRNHRIYCPACKHDHWSGTGYCLAVGCDCERSIIMEPRMGMEIDCLDSVGCPGDCEECPYYGEVPQAEVIATLGERK